MLTGWTTIIWLAVAMATDPSSQPLQSESHEWIEGDRKHTVHTCMQGCVCVRKEGCVLEVSCIASRDKAWVCTYSMQDVLSAFSSWVERDSGSSWETAPSLWKPDLNLTWFVYWMIVIKIRSGEAKQISFSSSQISSIYLCYLNSICQCCFWSHPNPCRHLTK